MKRMNNCLNLVPYHTIEKAVSGDVNALNRILKYYEDYIIRLSAGTLYDENGEQYYHVNEELRRRLETKLIIAILTFELI